MSKKRKRAPRVKMSSPLTMEAIQGARAAAHARVPEAPGMVVWPTEVSEVVEDAPAEPLRHGIFVWHESGGAYKRVVAAIPHSVLMQYATKESPADIPVVVMGQARDFVTKIIAGREP